MQEMGTENTKLMLNRYYFNLNKNIRILFNSNSEAS